MRVSWINAGEMFWFASPRGGANLVVNDGFSAGARGLYEIHVAPDGTVRGPKLLMDFGEEFPTASAVVALDDVRYGVLTMRFPAVDETLQPVAFYSVERDQIDRVTAPVLVAQPAQVPRFVGGTEPPYVAALARNGGVDVAYPDPENFQIVIARIEGSSFVERARLTLVSVLPLSSDCLLWDVGSALALRVGLESAEGNELFRIPDGPDPLTGLISRSSLPGQPIYAFSERFIVLAESEAGGSRAATLDTYDWSGAFVAGAPGGVLQSGLEPFSATPSPDGVLLAPVSDDPVFGELGVARLADDGSVQRIAELDRSGDDELYSARAFGVDGRVYLAWTSYHGGLMDLWVGVVEASP
jgi:hypothetical protein